MWTAAPGEVLAVGVADCVPAFVWDVRARRVALVHAGWRGTAAGILGKTITTWLEAGAAGADLRVALGPSIGPCCYRVQSEVAAHFDPRAIRRTDESLHLDLWSANRLQAEGAGVAPQHIDAAPPCTGCNSETFFSHRFQGPRTGRMWALTWIRPQA
jgi:YfiH family protein